MDIAIESRTLTASRDYSLFANKFGWDAFINGTILISDLVKATHYPEGFVKVGIILAKYTSGGNAGLWTPWVENDASGTGKNTIAGMAFSGFDVRTTDGVAVATKTSGAIIPKGVAAQVYLAKVPGLLLTDGTTANPILAADLATLGFINVAE